MKPEDTVMSREEIDTIVKNLTEAEGITVEQAVAQAQAQISFPAGIQEAVEWIERNTKQFQGIPYFDSEKWQAKLKEWRA